MKETSHKKNLKLRAFEIQNNELSQSNSGLLSILSQKLRGSVAQNRRMRLNVDDPKNEEDLVSDYDVKENYLVLGVVLRIMPSDDVPNIPDELFDQEKIEMNELDTIHTQSSNIYKEHYYFMLNNRYLITTLSSNKPITRFQTYINWLLDKERGTKLFEFTPIIKPAPEVRLGDLKEIKISDTSIRTVSNGGVNNSNDDFVQKIKNLGKEAISFFLNDTQNFSEIELEQIVSAELLIKFAKPKKKDEENLKRSLSALLKPISETDNVVFRPKKGPAIKGCDLLWTKSVEIDTTETNKISEPQLFQEMEKVLSELENENSN